MTPETQVVFDLMFEERLQRVRCRPGDPAIGTLSTTALAESGELSGSFDRIPLNTGERRRSQSSAIRKGDLTL